MYDATAFGVCCAPAALCDAAGRMRVCVRGYARVFGLA